MFYDVVTFVDRVRYKLYLQNLIGSENKNMLNVGIVKGSSLEFPHPATSHCYHRRNRGMIGGSEGVRRPESRLAC